MVFKAMACTTLMGAKFAMMETLSAAMAVRQTAKQSRQDGNVQFGENLAVFFAEMESWIHPTIDY